MNEWCSRVRARVQAAVLESQGECERLKVLNRQKEKEVDDIRQVHSQSPEPISQRQRALTLLHTHTHSRTITHSHCRSRTRTRARAHAIQLAQY